MNTGHCSHLFSEAINWSTYSGRTSLLSSHLPPVQRTIVGPNVTASSITIYGSATHGPVVRLKQQRADFTQFLPLPQLDQDECQPVSAHMPSGAHSIGAGKLIVGT
jgi:hypothetical protein